jgi:hypothetical protein
MPQQPGYLRTWDALLTAYFSKDMGPVHADLNLGMNLWQLPDPLVRQPWVALALSLAAPHGLTPMVELYYFAAGAPILPEDAGFLAALGWAPRPWLVFDTGFDVGLLPRVRSVSGFVGMTVIPVDLWETTREIRARAAKRR